MATHRPQDPAFAPDFAFQLTIGVLEAFEDLVARRRSFARRIEAVDRIQQAASGLVERISEIEAGEEALGSLERRLQELTSQLIALPGLEPAASDAHLVSA